MTFRPASRIAALILGLALATALPAQAAERILIDGSTGVTPLVAALAKAYHQQNPGTTIEIGKGMGTKARIEALREGKIDIAMASHGLKVDDIKRQGMAVHEIGKVAVVFGVNASVSATGLTDRQVCDIYSVKVGNWKELGASDLPIVPFTRPDSEVDAIVARESIDCMRNLQMPDAVKVAPKSGEMARELAATTGAIGMTTMTVVEQSGGKIKAVSLRGIAPTASNVRNKTYTLVRDSFLVTRETPSAAVAKFLDFVRSTAGEKVIIANGAVPVK